MEIKHVNGEVVNTDNLSDVDAMLMEESKKLHELFQKYNRQLFLVGEMKGKEEAKVRGSVFFHIMPLGAEGQPVDVEEYKKAAGIYWGRIDVNIRGMTNHQLGIGVIPPPQVQPWPEPPKE